MALKCSNLLGKISVKNILPLLGSNNRQHLQIVVHYCDSTKSHNLKLSQAMQSYLEKAKKYDKFLKEQLQEYQIGKEFLASMMGKKSKNMTQEEIDKAIEYLFPSRLFVPKARPMMKPPLEIYEKQKEAAFDYTGRPHHFLFYTARPKYFQCLHDAAVKLEKLNSLKFNPANPPKPLPLINGKWLTLDELKKKFQEKLFELEYEKFLEVFKALASHPFASEAKDLINCYWKSSDEIQETQLPEKIIIKDDVKTVTIESARRKTSSAKVHISHPGTGQIRINNVGLDYFSYMNSREQVSG